MIKRGEALARSIALLALAGWLWLLIEPVVRRYLERRKQGVGNFVANFLTQSIQQEMLFFCLPLIIGATQRDVGQIVFAALAVIAALLSTLDHHEAGPARCKTDRGNQPGKAAQYRLDSRRSRVRLF